MGRCLTLEAFKHVPLKQSVATECSKDDYIRMVEELMLTRRRFLGYTALAPAALSRALWANSPLEGSTDEPAPQISAQALAVHKRALIFDGHVHASDREFYHGGSMGTRKPDGQWDLPRAREGGVSAFFLSVFIPEEYYPGRFETKQAFRRVDDALRQLQENSGLVALALNADDVERIHAQGKMAAVLDIEGSYDLDGDLGVLRDLYRIGIAFGTAFGAQLGPELRRLLLLAGQMEGAHPAWPRTSYAR
jgi:membrane dipeptidase